MTNQTQFEAMNRLGAALIKKWHRRRTMTKLEFTSFVQSCIMEELDSIMKEPVWVATPPSPRKQQEFPGMNRHLYPEE